jgi:ankyrin repeat protein
LGEPRGGPDPDPTLRRCLAKDKINRTALHHAAKYGHVEVAKLLLDRGAKIEAKDINDLTPLHLAASNGYLEVDKLLFDRGADIEAKDTDKH